MHISNENSQNEKHVSKEIIGLDSNVLKGKKIVLCITASVAAYKAIDLSRMLMRNGAEVYPVMSNSTESKLLTKEIMDWATGNKAVTELTSDLEHIALANYGKSDLIVVYPCTANTLGKFVNGIEDNPVTTILSVALGSRIPIVIAPAMHEAMYENIIIAENIKKLKTLGVSILEPLISEDKAKVISADNVVQFVIHKIGNKKDGITSRMNVLVTAGSTVEYIDSVRILTNLSSGKMGLNIAQQCLDRGFNVTLVYGHGSLNIPDDPKMNIIRIKTTEEMFKVVRERILRLKQHVVFHAAAVADFSISHPSKNRPNKMDTRNGTKTIKLVPTTKIVDTLKQLDKKILLVAFKTEYDISEELLIKKAIDKLKECNGDLIVANDVSRKGCDFGSDTNEVYIIDKDKNIIHIPLKSKREIARNLVKIVCKKLKID
ncbi:MAG TPA: bifunctional phosphopantothenoylcysteine decarboxylase/phosphopantothenate--cysteine ligase CoaBC [Nitrososphaeraceae archaeon]|jgi:phosphopantothenoylcysteine decarboxylase/phosphopantothenate--cysteine ligase|nr:bifunctional phosphopantothenoylcysteine decarboxylase/phosphopantothenate--cysteine ligase CoaBC [Nitrososphaeraceae archaeon]